ncbi:Zinc finger, BED-type [Trema orientale]|uniref:Zinc finger, BED-type n=1 Tax=Trema orientale TaxID=63057 RepID=A0A2P5C468_TREOI|nr:Zinc finger, BED-type [Trema orientale]
MIDLSISENLVINLDGLQDVEIDEESKEEVSKQSSKRKRKLTSSIWPKFELVPSGPNGKQKAKRNHYGMVYFANRKYGTGNLKRHLDGCLRRNRKDEGAAMTIGGHKFDPEKFSSLITQAILMQDLLFNFVEYAGIRLIFSYLHPAIQLVSRNTTKVDTLKLFRKEKAVVKSLLEAAPGRVSFTSDLQSSFSSDGYLYLTCHFIRTGICIKKC